MSTLPEAGTPNGATNNPGNERRAALVTLILLIACALAMYAEFLLGNKQALFLDIGSDSYVNHYPYLVHYLQHLREGSPWGWSFSPGFGQMYLPYHLHGGVLAFPLLLVPPTEVSSWLGPFEAAKLVLAGWFTYLFLRERRLPHWIARIGAVGYATSGYMTITSSWPQLSAEAALLPAMFLGVERLRSSGSPWCFLMATAAMATIQPVAAFMNVILAGTWMVTTGWARGETLSTGAKRLFTSGLAACLGVGLVGLFIVPVLHLMLASPRVSGEGSLMSSLFGSTILQLAGDKELATAYLRLFGVDLAGNGSQYLGWYNFLEGPLYSCGSLFLLAVPAAWRGWTSQTRRLFSCFVLLVILVTMFHWFRHAFWLFSGNYYRTLNSAVVLPLIAFTARALATLETKGHVSVRAVSGTIVLLLLPCLLPSVSSIAETDALLRTAGFISVTACILCLRNTQGLSPVGWRVLLLVAVSVEGVVGVRASLQSRPTLTSVLDVSGIGYHDGTSAIINRLKAHSTEPYRVVKSYRFLLSQDPPFNDAMLQGYWGGHGYSSFNLASTVRFFTAFGLSDLTYEPSTRWIGGIERWPLLQAAVGARYLLTRHHREVIATENPLTLPMVFHYSKIIPELEWQQLTPLNRQRVLLAAGVIPSNQVSFIKLPTLSVDKIQGSESELHEWMQARRQNAPAIQQFNEDGVSVVSEGDDERLLTFLIPADTGWHATLNGKDAPLLGVNFAFQALRLPPGRHVVNLTYTVPGIKTGTLISIASAVLIGIWCLLRSRRTAVGSRQ